MVGDTFHAAMNQERERLGKERERLLNQRAEIDAQLSEIEHALQGLSAFESHMSRKPSAAAAQSAGEKTKGSRRGGFSDKVFDIIRTRPDGLFVGDIAHVLEAGGIDRKGLGNVLNKLKKAGKITQREPRGRYMAAGMP
jgi:hypothetical protein